MSWTRLPYDSCGYNKELAQSTSSFRYTMDPVKYYQCSNCRVPFGVVGGNEVSVTKGNMVNLESDLQNRTRELSKCPERKYLPSCYGPVDDLCETVLIQYPRPIEHTGVEQNLHLVCTKPMRTIGQATYQPFFNPTKIAGAPINDQ